jgi:hypothetical protein
LWSFGIFFGYLAYFVVIWYIFWLSGIFCGHLVYCLAIWHILWSFGIFSPGLVCFTEKNLATLVRGRPGGDKGCAIIAFYEQAFALPKPRSRCYDRHFFRIFFSENILKIITSVPGANSAGFTSPTKVHVQNSRAG